MLGKFFSKPNLPLVNPRRIRIAFVDDEDNEFVDIFKDWSYDVELIKDVERLDPLVNGRYQLIFLDIRGVGSKLKMDGIGVLEHIKKRNPLIHVVVCSGARFNSEETRKINQYANDIIPKDASIEEYISVIEDETSTITPDAYLSYLSGLGINLKLNKTYRLASDNKKLSAYIANKSPHKLDASTLSNMTNTIVNLLALLQ